MSERNLDQLLDAALPAYLAEPPGGMESRILAKTKRRFVLPWVGGLAAAAAVVLSIASPRPATLYLPPPVLAHASAAPPVHFSPTRVRANRPVRALPLTRPERVLLQFARANPEFVQQVFVEAPKQMALELTIQPLVIEPLSTGGE